MKVTYFRRECSCNQEECVCGSTWALLIDIGKVTRSGKRRQILKSGFKTKQEAIDSVKKVLGQG